ncbi:MAG: phage head-tail adapter protein [Candidimonas sp.]|nr:MAG: phage head-tail adapter protein [Candidimonas sp.]TAM23753.1 MAG: phage head-tail adapter protein [Candidimonas sp.]
MTSFNEFSGVPVSTLQSWLADAMQAQHDLLTGGKGESYSYTQGDGNKSVTFTRVNMADLAAYILRLKMALGLGSIRPLRPYF